MKSIVNALHRPLQHWRGIGITLTGVLLILLTGNLASRVFAQHIAPTLYTQTGAVTALAQETDGSIWATTNGGVLRWTAGSISPRCWTTLDGLSSNDFRALALTAGEAWIANAHALQRITITGEVRDESTAFRNQEIRSLAAAPDGCWVGTSTGVYRVTGKTELVRKDDTRRLLNTCDTCWAVTTSELVRLTDGAHWPLPDTTGNITALAFCHDTLYLATALGFWQWANNEWSTIPLPAGSPGSHVSALAGDDTELIAALYGDGIYRRRGGVWQRPPATPDSLRFVTSLLPTTHGLVAGTRNDGVWRQEGDVWRPLSIPPGIPSADIYAVCSYRAAIWASTFDKGLLYWSGGHWRQVMMTDGLSSDSPRDLVVFHDMLYVRHTTGEVDRFDGKAWRPAFTKRELPRPGIYAMATNGNRLYLGGWAGWAATDGHFWEYHFSEQQLRGLAVTAIAAGDGTVWVGTQKQGILAWRGVQVTPYNERQGLTDDWITRIVVMHHRVLVGTYTGGLLEWTPSGFHLLFNPQGFAIRDLCQLPGVGALAATPLGIFVEDGNDWRLIDPARYGGMETQTLYPVPGGMWVGSRSALARLPIDVLRQEQPAKN